MTAALLEVEHLTKRFGPNRALSGVHFDLRAGEVHALIGENGAGKSTLMKILSGAERPSSGSMLLDVAAYAPRSPRDALNQGVAMIYQELALAPHLTVEANIMLGQEQTRLGLLRRAQHREIVRRALSTLDHHEIEPDRLVRDLSVGAQQLVEVARALVLNARIVILDEPTSSLTEHDARRLFRVIRRLRDQGLGIIYISHFLREVQEIADRYTVLRDGASVGSGTMAGTSLDDLVALMVGRPIDDIFPHVPHALGDPILDVDELQGRRFPILGRLSLRRGEILGIAGLVGSGRSELIRAIYGLDAVRKGRVVVRGAPLRASSPAQAVRLGLGYVSEDRKSEGLALGRSIEDNMTYARMSRHARFGWLRLGERRQTVQELIRRSAVRCRGAREPVGQLSGGNQQKVALARLLHQQAEILLLDEPTRGIDIGAKAEIYRQIGSLASQGTAVIWVSSDLPELLGVCDSLAVMRRGVLSEVRPIADWTEQSVMAAATS